MWMETSIGEVWHGEKVENLSPLSYMRLNYSFVHINTSW